MQYDPIKENEPLLAEIASFCAASGMSETKLGAAAFNDTAFVHTLRRGRQLTQRTLAVLRDFMSKHHQGAA